MNNDKRMAGEYEILHAITLGDREIVMGEHPNAEPGQRYMTALGEWNDLFCLYYDVMVSDSYTEIIGLFGKHIAEQAEKVKQLENAPKIQGINNTPITADDCTPITCTDDINNRIVIIKPEALRREYRVATHQIKLCMGGFGASSNSRGSACYCVDLYSGKQARYERQDVLGTLTREQLPEWAEQGLRQHEQNSQKKLAHKSRNEVER